MPRSRTECSTAIDRHVGARIREQRVMMGVIHEQLAALFNVSYQQMHKYERGLNCVSAGRLFEIARLLSRPVGYFYAGVEGNAAAVPPSLNAVGRLTLEMARSSQATGDPRLQEAVTALMHALANGQCPVCAGAAVTDHRPLPLTARRSPKACGRSEARP